MSNTTPRDTRAVILGLKRKARVLEEDYKGRIAALTAERDALAAQVKKQRTLRAVPPPAESGAASALMESVVAGLDTTPLDATRLAEAKNGLRGLGLPLYVDLPRLVDAVAEQLNLTRAEANWLVREIVNNPALKPFETTITVYGRVVVRNMAVSDFVHVPSTCALITKYEEAHGDIPVGTGRELARLMGDDNITDGVDVFVREFEGLTGEGLPKLLSILGTADRATVTHVVDPGCVWTNLLIDTAPAREVRGLIAAFV